MSKVSVMNTYQLASACKVAPTISTFYTWGLSINWKLVFNNFLLPDLLNFFEALKS